MLEGDGKPKSINLNRILFLFFFLCFAFPLNFFKISLGMSLVLQFHIWRISPSFFSHLLQISLLFIFFVPLYFFVSKTSSIPSFQQ